MCAANKLEHEHIVGVETIPRETAALVASAYWEQGTEMPIKLGEVASVLIDDVLYAFGEGNALTYGYDVATVGNTEWMVLAER